MSKAPQNHEPPSETRSNDAAMIEAALREARTAARAAESPGSDVVGFVAPPPDAFAGYDVIDEVHRGGQGVVFRAIQKATRREVAIKVRREGPFTSQADAARFDREVQVLGLLNHPNIVAVHDTGIAAGSHYFVMDYVSGQPLDVFMARGERTIDETLRLFAKICAAVNAAHLRGVIHRDLKPSNILIDDEGEPHVLDFGLAKPVPGEPGIVGDVETMTVPGQFIGSLPWASPEQAEGVPAKIDVRTDVYSLGVILYQMLTRRFPYEVVGNIRDVIDNILTGEPARPSTIRKQINDEVETIVLECLQKERERRYQTAGELARDVNHYLNGEPIEAKRDSAGYVLRKQLRKYRRPVVVAAGFVLLLIGSGIALGVQSARTAREAKTAKEINAFFNDMLAALDPMQLRLFAGFAPDEGIMPVTATSLEWDLSVAEMLRRANANIEERFAGKPELEAHARETIGMTFQSLQLYEDAAEHLRAALEIRQRVLGDDHPDTLRSQLQVGFSIRDSLAGGAAEAERLVRCALAGMRRLYGDEHPKTLTAARVLADVLAHQRKYGESAQCFRDTLDAQIRVLGPENRNTLMTRYYWAISNLYKGRETAAAELARELYEISQRALDPDDSITIMSEVLLGAFESRQGRYEEAENLLRAGLEKSRTTLGPDHPHTYFTMMVLAQSLSEEDQKEEKEQLYRDALEGRRATVGLENRETLATNANLVWFLCRQGRFEEAIGLQQPVVEMLVQERGEDDMSTFIAMRLLTRALWGAGRHDEARKYTVRAIAAGKRLAERPDAPVFDLAHCARFLLTCEPAELREPETALGLAEKAVEMGDDKEPRALETLALAYRQTGDLDKAVKTLNKARGLLPPADLDRRMLDLALALLDAGQYGAYERLCSEATFLGANQRHDGYGNIAGRAVCVGAALVEEARCGEAEPILRACLELERVTLPPGDPRIGITMSILGAALVGQGKFAEAESLSIEGYERMSRRPAALGPKQRALERIIKLYEAWDKPDQAAEWGEKLATLQRTTAEP